MHGVEGGRREKEAARAASPWSRDSALPCKAVPEDRRRRATSAVFRRWSKEGLAARGRAVCGRRRHGRVALARHRRRRRRCRKVAPRVSCRSSLREAGLLSSLPQGGRRRIVRVGGGGVAGRRRQQQCRRPRRARPRSWSSSPPHGGARRHGGGRVGGGAVGATASSGVGGLARGADGWSPPPPRGRASARWWSSRRRCLSRLREQQCQRPRRARPSSWSRHGGVRRDGDGVVCGVAVGRLPRSRLPMPSCGAGAGTSTGRGGLAGFVAATLGLAACRRCRGWRGGVQASLVERSRWPRGSNTRLTCARRVVEAARFCRRGIAPVASLYKVEQLPGRAVVGRSRRWHRWHQCQGPTG